MPEKVLIISAMAINGLNLCELTGIAGTFNSLVCAISHNVIIFDRI